MTSLFLSVPIFVLLLLAVVGAVVLLYLLRPPVLNRLISSNLIWKRVLGSSRAISERWRWWLSLLLALLITTCLFFSALRPSVDGEVDSRVLIILDNSPSMGALTQSGASRYDIAKIAVSRLLDSFSKDVEVMLVDTQRQITSPDFDSIAQNQIRLEELTIGSNLEPIVPSHVAELALTRKFIYTDGVMIGGVPDDFTIVSVFQPAPNVGITRLSFASVPGDINVREAFIEIVNGGGSPQLVDLELVQSEARVLKRRIQLGPYEKSTQIFNASKLLSGPVKASVYSSEDLFKFDDVAYGYITTKSPIKVGIVSDATDSKAFTLLSLMPRISLTALTLAEYEEIDLNKLNFDTLVFDGVTPANKPTVPSMIFGITSSNWVNVKTSPIRSSQIIVDKNLTHPILKNVAMTDLSVEGGVVFEVTENVETLLNSDAEGVLAIAIPGAIKNILVGFDLNKTNLPYLLDFPILLSNSIKWLVDEPPVMTVNSGVIQVPGDVTKVFRIDGTDMPLWFANGNAYFYSGEAGLFTAFTRNGPLRVSVSQLDRRFSDINGSQLKKFDPSLDSTNSGFRGYSFTLVIGIMALLLIMLEWFFYHRRITQ